MKRNFANVLFGLVSVITCASAVGAQEITLSPAPRSVTTEGDAVVNVVPDKFALSFRVRTSGKQLLDAYDENERTAAKILELGQRYKLKTEDVQTSSISFHPEYGRSSTSISTNHVERDICFILKDRKMIAPLIRDSLNAGATSLLNVTFETSELRKYRDHARVLALQAAKEKAELLAKTFNANIGKPLRIEEQSSGSSYRHPYAFQVANNIAQTVGGSEESDVDSAIQNAGIAVGRIQIRASVKTVFELQ